MSSSIIDTNLDIKVRKVERFEKQKILSKYVTLIILSQTSLLSSSNSVEKPMFEVAVMSKRTSNDTIIFRILFEQDP